MCVVTYQKGKVRAGGQKHLIYAERESHKAVSLAAGERGHFGRMEVEIRLTAIDLVWDVVGWHRFSLGAGWGNMSGQFQCIIENQNREPNWRSHY